MRKYKIGYCKTSATKVIIVKVNFGPNGKLKSIKKILGISCSIVKVITRAIVIARKPFEMNNIYLHIPWNTT